MADLKALAPQPTLRVQLVHPTKGPLDAWVILAGPAHPATKAYAREALDRRFKTPDPLKVSVLSVDDLDDLADETTLCLVARTLGWEGIEENGEPIPFTTDAAKRIYSDPDNAWLRNLVDRSLTKDSLFFAR